MLTKKEYAAIKQQKLPKRLQDLVEKFWYTRSMARRFNNDSDAALKYGCEVGILEYMIQHIMLDINPEEWNDMFEKR